MRRLDDLAFMVCPLLFGFVDWERGTPHPGCFGKRGWNCLKTRALTFLEKAKRLQVAGAAGDRPKTEGKKSDRNAPYRPATVVFYASPPHAPHTNVIAQ